MDKDELNILQGLCNEYCFDFYEIKNTIGHISDREGWYNSKMGTNLFWKRLMIAHLDISSIWPPEGIVIYTPLNKLIFKGFRGDDEYFKVEIYDL